MDFSQNETNLVRRYGGIGIVALLHALVAYSVITGLALKVVDVLKQPVETKFIEEVKLPPPPEKAPPPPPKLVAPPPPFIPPPEVQIQQSVQQNVIANVAPTQPTSNAMAPAAKPEPAAASVRIAAVVDHRACQKPEYPHSAMVMEETGVVTLAFLIGVDGRVIDSRVDKSSGYGELDKAARAALSLCKFKPGSVDGKPEQSWTKMQYVWQLNE